MQTVQRHRAATGAPLFKRLVIFAYGLVSYAVYFVTFLYAIGFIGNLWAPKTMDSPREATVATVLLVNLGLLALFAVQHSLMERPAFKRWWTRFVPESAERSTYVLFSSLALIALPALWQPLGGMIWQVGSPVGRAVLRGGFAFGWGLVLLATFLINHFDLFGLRQVWLQLTGKPYRPLKFVTPAPYRVVRHPLYLGWLCVFWSTPEMSVPHLLFAVMTTAYILVGIRLEEHDLVAAHPEYESYRRRVPMLIPAFRRVPAADRPLADPRRA